MVTENTACVLVEKDGRLLLVKRTNRTFRGWWCLPGGHGEEGETPEQTAQREAIEEVGGVAVGKSPFLVFVHDWPADRHTNEPHRHRCHVFHGKIVGRLRAGSDAGRMGWFAPEEVKKLKLTNYTERVLREIGNRGLAPFLNRKQNI